MRNRQCVVLGAGAVSPSRCLLLTGNDGESSRRSLSSSNYYSNRWQLRLMRLGCLVPSPSHHPSHLRRVLYQNKNVRSDLPGTPVGTQAHHNNREGRMASAFPYSQVVSDNIRPAKRFARESSRWEEVVRWNQEKHPPVALNGSPAAS